MIDKLCHTLSDPTELGPLERAAPIIRRMERVDPDFPMLLCNLVPMHASVGDNIPVDAHFEFYIFARKGLRKVLRVEQAEVVFESYRNFLPCPGFDEVLCVSMGGDADRTGWQLLRKDAANCAADTDFEIGNRSNRGHDRVDLTMPPEEMHRISQLV
jgi:hypothetical protein